jgi:hypothetical protein
LFDETLVSALAPFRRFRHVAFHKKDLVLVFDLDDTTCLAVNFWWFGYAPAQSETDRRHRQHLRAGSAVQGRGSPAAADQHAERRRGGRAVAGDPGDAAGEYRPRWQRVGAEPVRREGRVGRVDAMLSTFDNKEVRSMATPYLAAAAFRGGTAFEQYPDLRSRKSALSGAGFRPAKETRSVASHPASGSGVLPILILAAVLTLWQCISRPQPALAQHSPPAGASVALGGDWCCRQGRGEAAEFIEPWCWQGFYDSSCLIGSSGFGYADDDAAALLLGWEDAFPTGPDLLRRPHIQSTTATSTIVAWVTDRAGGAGVRYSLNHSYTITVPATTEYINEEYYHAATLTGLEPDTTYNYKIFQGDADLTPWSVVTFTTAKEEDDPYFAFVAFGDSRNATSGTYAVHEQMRRWDFDFVLHGGDIVYSGEYPYFEIEYFRVYSETIKSIPFFLAIGNHDTGSAYRHVYYLPQNAWRADDKEKYYSFDWGNAHFVSLDTNSSLNEVTPGIADEDMQEWLIDDLANTAKFWKIVFLHHPPYSSGYHGSDLDVRDTLVPVFEDYGVDVAFTSHDHDYERTISILHDSPSTAEDGGIVYLVSGGGGAPLYGDPQGDWFTAYAEAVYHFILVEIANCTLTLETIDTAGTIFDSLTIDRCSELQFSPALDIVKEGPFTANVRDTVIYTFTVTNDDVDGDGSSINDVLVNDDVAGTATFVNGDDGDDRLEVGETWVYTASYTIQATDPDPLVNAAVVTGKARDGADIPDATDVHRMDIGDGTYFIFLPVTLLSMTLLSIALLREPRLSTLLPKPVFDIHSDSS